MRARRFRRVPWALLAVVCGGACGRLGFALEADLDGGRDRGLADTGPERLDGGAEDAPDGSDAPPDVGGDGEAAPCDDAGTTDCAPDDIVELSVGAEHVCARSRAGELACWGRNHHGQLGDGTAVQRARPIPVLGVAGATQVSAGTSHSCALTAAGEAWCWGSGRYGQLGDGTATDHVTPVRVEGLPGVPASIAAGGVQSCARLADGRVSCWGLNASGELGDGTYATSATPVVVEGVADATELVLGSHFGCARDDAGAVRCWGANDLGHLGVDPVGGSAPSAVSVALAAPAVALSAGGASALAVLATARVQCWGYNPTGLCALPATPAVPPRELTDPGGVVAAATGGYHSCALLDDGLVHCWGRGQGGELNDLALQNRSVPRPIPEVTRAVALGAGYGFTCARRDLGDAVCWGGDAYGALGDGTPASVSAPVRVDLGLEAIAVVSVSGAHTCGAGGDGATRCVGLNISGELGDGSLVTTSAPRLVGGLTFAALAAAPSHTCGIERTTRRPYCWGYNHEGQLGDGTTLRRLTPVEITALGAVDRVAADYVFSCAVTSADRVLWCWGDNSEGQLGIGSTVDQRTPAAVSLPGPVRALAVGRLHACVVLGSADGPLYCWGDNGVGQLGVPGGDATAPVRVGTLDDWVSVAAGSEHTCAARAGGELYCWGRNDLGQLGLGVAGPDEDEPVLVPDVSVDAGHAESVAAGGAHTCVRRADGVVVCFGSGERGELGDGTTAGRPTPAPIAGAVGTVEAVAARRSSTCALTTAGELYCWGDAFYGQLADGSSVRLAELTSVRMP